MAEIRRADGKQGASSPATDTREAAVIRDAERSLAEARGKADAIVSEAEREASEIAAAAESARNELLAGARESAGRAAAETKKDAMRTASAIVKEAEEKAAEIVAAAEGKRAQVEHELTQLRQDFAAEKREGAVDTACRYLLGDVQRAFPGGTTTVRALPKARETSSDSAEAAD